MRGIGGSRRESGAAGFGLALGPLFIVLAISGCSGDGDESVNGPGQLPGVPQNLSAQAGDAEVTLTWDAAKADESYEIFWNNAGGVSEDDALIEATSSPYTHTGLSNGTAYYYTVRARNDVGTSALSAEVSATPTAGEPGAAVIGCGWYSSLTATETGQLSAWGDNTHGQLGIGSWLSQSLPVWISGFGNVIDMDGGQNHSIVLRSDGSVWTCGYNDNGQLGDGGNQPQWYLQQVPGLPEIVDVAAGRYHSLAVDVDGNVWSWGYNLAGQLGDGTNTDRHSPVQINIDDTIVAVAGGTGHSMALSWDGNVYTWGANHAGQLGDGTTTPRNYPEAVYGIVLATDIGAGDRHSVVIEHTGDDPGPGEVESWRFLSWGANDNGQLGIGNTENSTTPVGVDLGANLPQAVACGTTHTLVLCEAGDLVAWGSNGYGQLGNGSTENSTLPGQVATLSNVVAIACGHGHNLAITSGGMLWSWGTDFKGQLGNGDAGSQLTPLPVTEFPPGSQHRFGRAE